MKRVTKRVTEAGAGGRYVLRNASRQASALMGAEEWPAPGLDDTRLN
jgi:hypothetical protein